MTESPDGTAIALPIVDDVGVVWSLSASGNVLRNGLRKYVWSGNVLLWSGEQLYISSFTYRSYLLNRNTGGATLLAPDDPIMETLLPNRPKINSYTADKTSVQAGSPVLLTWNTANGQATINGILVPSVGSKLYSPTSNHVYDLRVTGKGPDATASISITVIPAPPLAISTSSMDAAQVGVVCSDQLIAVNGTLPYTWSIGSGSLPSGVTISQSGLIAGTPTTSGSFAFSAKVMDAQSQSATKSLLIDVAAASVPSPTIANFVANPSLLPLGGGPITLSADVVNATSVKLDGVDVTLPTTVNVAATKTFQLVAHGQTAPDATASVVVTVAIQQSGPLSTLAANTARNLGPYANSDPQFNTFPLNAAAITDYSGLCADPIGNRVLLFGGGHGPSQETDIRVFDLVTLQWGSLYPSTAVADMTIANFDGDKGRFINTNQPTSRHTYNSMVVRGRKLWVMNPRGMPMGTGGMVGGTSPDNGTWGGRICAYDLDAQVWSFKQWGSQYVSPPNAPWEFDDAATLDPVSQKILITGAGGSIWLYDPDADLVSTGPAFNAYASNAAVYCPLNDKFYIFTFPYNSGLASPCTVLEVTVNRTNFSSSTVMPITTTGSPPSATLGLKCAFAWDSANNVIGGNPDAGVFYTFEPIARVWTATPMQVEAGSSGIPDLSFHNLAFDPTSGCYVFLQNPAYGSGQVPTTWAYRFRGVSGDGTGTVTTPVGTLTAALDFGGGKVAAFSMANAIDNGDFVGEFVHQKCFLAVDPNFPDWRVWFRPDADGTRDEVVVEYGRSTSSAAAHWLTPYTATIKKGTATIYSAIVPRHMHYGRWRYQSAQRPVVRDATLLKSHGWIPNLGTSGMYGGGANTLNVSWVGPMISPDLVADAFNPYMEQGGDHDEIGYLTEQGASYMIFGAAANLTTLRTQGEWCGNWCMHIRDDATGAMPSFRDTTTFFKDNGGTINGEMTDPFTSPTSNFVKVQAAHWYANANGSWLLTEDPFMLEELQFGVNWRMLWNKSPRVTQNLGGLMYPGETRAYAWGLRDMFLLAASTPASVPSWLRSQSHWQSCLDDNLVFALRFANSPAKMHSLFRMWPSTPTEGSWTQSWLTSVIGQGIEMGFTTWQPVFDWAIQGQLAFVNGTSGWNRQWPAPYKVCAMKNDTTFKAYAYNPYPVLDSSYDSAICTSWGDLWAFYKTGGNGHTDDNGHTISDAYEATWDGHTPMAQFYQVQPPGGFAGYYVYYLHFRSAIVQAVRRGTPGAQACYDYLQAEMANAFSHYGGGGHIGGEARFSVSP